MCTWQLFDNSFRQEKCKRYSNRCSTYTFKSVPYWFARWVECLHCIVGTVLMLYHAPCNRANSFISNNFHQVSLNTSDPWSFRRDLLETTMPLGNFKNHFGVICAWVNIYVNVNVNVAIARTNIHVLLVFGFLLLGCLLSFSFIYCLMQCPRLLTCSFVLYLSVL